MEYALTPVFTHTHERIALTQEEYDQIVAAMRALVVVIAIEQKFDLLLENYVEFENELLGLAQRAVVFSDLKWRRFQHENQLVARRLVNLLSSARLYVDQVDHDLTRIFGKDHRIAASVRRACHDQYDASFGFRLMETLRNAVQHRSLSALQLRHHYGTVNRDDEPDPMVRAKTRQVVVRVIPILDFADLDDMDLKASVRADLEAMAKEHIDLTLYVREYVDGLTAMHREFRSSAQEDQREWETAARGALASGREKWPGGTASALAVTAFDPAGEAVESTQLIPEFLEYLTALQTKNATRVSMARAYASGHCGDD